MKEHWMLAVRNGLCSLTLAVVVLMLSGCIDVRTKIYLESDGSGTVTTVQYSPPPESGQDMRTDRHRLLTNAENAARAMGDGVTLYSISFLPDHNDWKGVKFVYKFDDINRLRMPVFPSSYLWSAQEIAYTFQYSAGELTINRPPLVLRDARHGDETAPFWMPYAKPERHAGQYFQLRIEVAGRITQTDADYVSGSRRILLERCNLGELVKDRDAQQALWQACHAHDAEEYAAILKSEPISKYVQSQSKDQVFIKFK